MYSKTCVAIAEVALPGTGITGMWGRAGQRLTQVHQPKGECWGHQIKEWYQSLEDHYQRREYFVLYVGD